MAAEGHQDHEDTHLEGLLKSTIFYSNGHKIEVVRSIRILQGPFLQVAETLAQFSE
jgi:hypothetical protein